MEQGYIMHKEYNRRTPNNNAVLFIHGIVGTPDHFKDFVPSPSDN